MQIEFLIDNHRFLHILVYIDPAVLLRHRVGLNVGSGHDILIVFIPGCLQPVGGRRSTNGQGALLLHFAAAAVDHHLLLRCLLGVIVLHVHHLLERVVVLRTLLSQNLVHITRSTIDYRRLRDPIRSAAALGTRALARLVTRNSSTLFHGFLTEFQVHISQIGLARIYRHAARATRGRVAQPAAELRLLVPLLIALRGEVLHLHL